MENNTETDINLKPKNYRNRNEYIRNYQRNKYHANEEFRQMKIEKAKANYFLKKERLLFLENSYKEIS